MAFINFNAADVNPNSSFEPVPAGKYVAAIVDSTTKPTNAREPFKDNESSHWFNGAVSERHTGKLIQPTQGKTN